MRKKISVACPLIVRNFLGERGFCSSASWIGAIALALVASCVDGCGISALAKQPVPQQSKDKPATIVSEEADQSRKVNASPALLAGSDVSMRPVHYAFDSPGTSGAWKLERPLTLLASTSAQFRLLTDEKLADSYFQVEKARSDLQEARSDFDGAQETLGLARHDLSRFRLDYAAWVSHPERFTAMPKIDDGSYGQAFDLRGFTSEMQWAERHLYASRLTLYLAQQRESYWKSRTDSKKDFKMTLPSATRPMKETMARTLVGNWAISSSASSPVPNLGIDVFDANTASLLCDGVKDMQHYFILHVDAGGKATAEQFYTIFGQTYVLAAVLGQIDILGDDGEMQLNPPKGGVSVDVLKADMHSYSLAPKGSSSDVEYIKTLPRIKTARDNLAHDLITAFPDLTSESKWKLEMDDQETFSVDAGEGNPTYHLSRLYFGSGPTCCCPRFGPINVRD